MKSKNNNGITLVALVITIIVLLILAGVSISTLSGDDGIIARASDASEKTKTNSDAEEQKLKDTSSYIDEKVNQYNGGSISDSSLSHSGTVPEDAYYINLTTGTFYDVMPDTVSDGDAYLYGDYLYQFSSSYNGWIVWLATDDLGITTYIPEYSVTDKNQSSYGEILENINNKPIVYLERTFEGCISLYKAPNIPNNVTNMYYTFAECTKLTTSPTIPSSVKAMDNCFNGCTSLISAPIISSNVTNMTGTFANCISLTGNIEVNSSSLICNNCFYNTEKNIKIIGSSSEAIKSNLAATANNNNVTY